MKILALLISFIALISFSSCTREYVCECKITYTGKPGLPDSTIRRYDITDTKKKAEQECKDKSKSYTDNGITTKEACELY